MTDLGPFLTLLPGQLPSAETGPRMQLYVCSYKERLRFGSVPKRWRAKHWISERETDKFEREYDRYMPHLFIALPLNLNLPDFKTSFLPR